MRVVLDGYASPLVSRGSLCSSVCDSAVARSCTSLAAKLSEILSNWPYTFIAVMPTNKKLEAIAPEAAGSAARTMIETWGRLHAVRTSLGIVATLAYLWTLA